MVGSLRDAAGKARIAARIERLADGNAGNWRSVGDGVLELKIDFGPGYRVYYGRQGEVVYLLLVGGDKKTQAKDIRRAKEIRRRIDEEGLRWLST